MKIRFYKRQNYHWSTHHWGRAYLIYLGWYTLDFKSKWIPFGGDAGFEETEETKPPA